MPELPSGTVTFLFTDIEGSTRLLHQLGDAYADALAAHRVVLSDAVTRHNGVVVDMVGDAMFAAFARASDAVGAARDAQAGLEAGPIRVRIGIHTGEAIVADAAYVGADVHRGARIMAAGSGGQVVISETTVKLLEPTVHVQDLGEHRLKDLGASQRLYQLGEGEFPPLRTLFRTNLPTQPSALIGRERELAEAGALIRAHRLVTLTGPGGSGKTRLALQLAADAVDAFPDGIFWAPLQALRDPALVERAIASAIEADAGLIEHVATKRMLILLDNFEQVVEAAPAISSLLAGTTNAKVLVTSREPLHVESEQRYPVDPLIDDDATDLFTERARAVDPSFLATDTVREICRRLDGLPLAIELAAARVVLLDTHELLARLDQRLPLLASRSRDAPERQRTLRATIEWSYELLDSAERELFVRLGVFRGSFSIDAAEAVCGVDFETLESLLDKSLARRWGSGRVGLLDTIREYALDRLDASPEHDDVRRRHAEFFLAVAEGANLNGSLVRPAPQRLDIANLEQDNVRGALDWAIAAGEVAIGIELAVSLEQFWVTHDPSEGMRWFAMLLAHPAPEDVAIAARAEALRVYGSSAFVAGDAERAERLWQESLARFDELADEHGRAVLLHRLGISAMVRSDLVRARELVLESQAIHERTGDLWGQAQTVGTLGAIERDAQDEARAIELLGRSAELAGEAGVDWWKGGMLAELAALSVNAGRIDEGDQHARDALEIAERLHDRPGRVFGVGLLAVVAARRAQLERAGCLWGAIEDEDAGAPLGGWRRHRDMYVAQMADVADPEFESGRAKADGMTLDDAVLMALGTPTGLRE